MKRLFDIVFSFLVIIFLLPIGFIFVISIFFYSKNGAFYIQSRVGRYGKPFKLLKFRSMRIGSDEKVLLTIGSDDQQITKLGGFLRKYKLDEIPQLINIFMGDMSFVGPRPEVPKYVNLNSEIQKKVLDVRPGLTDYASLKYFDENRILSEYSDPEKVYIEKLLPDKLKLSLKYIEERNFLLDMNLIIKTILRLFNSNRQDYMA